MRFKASVFSGPLPMRTTKRLPWYTQKSNRLKFKGNGTRNDFYNSLEIVKNGDKKAPSPLHEGAVILVNAPTQSLYIDSTFGQFNYCRLHRTPLPISTLGTVRPHTPAKSTVPHMHTRKHPITRSNQRKRQLAIGNCGAEMHRS